MLFMSNIPQYYQHARTEMLPFIPPNAKKVLDVGCGVGRFGSVLKEKYGAEVWGVEMNPAAAEHASAVLDKVCCSEFNGSCFSPDSRFDCIVFNDVLEHMVCPEDALKSAKEMLTPEGVVVASIPNIRNFVVLWDLVVNGEWTYQDAGILDRTHLRFFTRSSIKHFFADAGLNVVRCEGINPRVARGKKFRLLNATFFNALSEMKFDQFAVVAKAS
jgi:2-polyprenyl-3-methyl-5-hydroxy-6-metoxy-1,4-benzoquinol methylase